MNSDFLLFMTGVREDGHPSSKLRRGVPQCLLFSMGYQVVMTEIQNDNDMDSSINITEALKSNIFINFRIIFGPMGQFGPEIKSSHPLFEGCNYYCDIIQFQPNLFKGNGRMYRRTEGNPIVATGDKIGCAQANAKKRWTIGPLLL